MARSDGQAGKKFFMLLLCGVWLFAAPARAATPDNSGPAGAGGGDTVSVGDLWSGITDTLEGLIPPKESFDPPAAPKEAAKKEEKAQPEVIKAKRLDAPVGTTAAPASASVPPPPPYKVYTAPRVYDDPPSTGWGPAPAVRNEAPARSQDLAFTGWESQTPKTVDLSKPPPLPEHVTRALRGEEAQPPLPVRASSPSIASALGMGPVRQEPAADAKTSGVPPISALPKQFFPVLAPGAGTDSPPQLLPIASNKELEADHSGVTRAIVFIHDMQRNSAEGVATLMTLSGAGADSTLIIAPQFPLNIDVTRFAQHLPDNGRNVARWQIENSWQIGGDSVISQMQRGVSSFYVVDLLLMFLSDRQRFPAMQDIVLVGHGMGGDFVHRYAVVGQAPDILAKDGVGLRFVVANASAYAYFTNLRPSQSGPGFTMADAASCPGVNSFPYGMNDLPSYAKRIGSSAIRLRYPERLVTFLFGDKFVIDNYLDQSCGAKAQGADRAARARAYERHLLQSFSDAGAASQTFVLVPNAGYDPVSLFGSSCGMAMLFGHGRCVPPAQ